MQQSEERRTEEAFRALQEIVSAKPKPGELFGRCDQAIQLVQLAASNGAAGRHRGRLKRARKRGANQFAQTFRSVFDEIAEEKRNAEFRHAVETFTRFRNTVGLWLQQTSPAARREFFLTKRMTVLEAARTAKGIPGAAGFISELEHAGDCDGFIRSAKRLLDLLWRITSAGTPPKTPSRSRPHEVSLSA